MLFFKDYLLLNLLGLGTVLLDYISHRLDLVLGQGLVATHLLLEAISSNEICKVNLLGDGIGQFLKRLLQEYLVALSHELHVVDNDLAKLLPCDRALVMVHSLHVRCDLLELSFHAFFQFRGHDKNFWWPFVLGHDLEP